MATAEEIVALLRERGVTVATCESLTAGLVAARLADVPGASAVLAGGLVTYATASKHRVAGVDTRVLDSDGPVAARTAEQMARGARTAFETDYAVALTGVAGPDPQDGHDPGEVFLAVAGPAAVRGTRVLIDGDRPAVRAGAVDAALALLVEQVREQSVSAER